MPGISTSDVSFAWGLESTEGDTSSVSRWKGIEVNGSITAGANVRRIEREFISPERQRDKGAVVGVDSPFSCALDLTWDSLNDFLRFFLFAQSPNEGLIFEGVSATGSSYSTGTIAADDRAKLTYASNGPRSLFMARGYSNPQNNGLKAVSSGTFTNSIPVSGLVSETNPPAGVVEYAGVRFGTSQLSLSVNANSREGTLTGSSSAVDWSDYGLVPGQAIRIGGTSTSTQFSAGVGTARVTEINGQVLSFDKASDGLASDQGTGEAVDILFGQAWMTVSRDHSLYRRPSLSFEIGFPGLSGGSNEYSYPNGNIPNEMVINMASESKVEATIGFVGRDTPESTTSRHSAANNPVRPSGTTLFNTSADLARIRVADDAAGYDFDFNSLNVTISNGVNARFVMGSDTARHVNPGLITVSFEMSAVFTSSAIDRAIRNNATMTLDFALQNGDGTVVFDFPAITLAGGAKEYVLGEPVDFTATASSFRDPRFGASIIVSTIPALVAEA